MSKYPGVERLPSGKIKYRGTTFAGFNKPRRSNRPEKKGMVLAKKGDKIKLIHFGDSSMGHNYSPAARKNDWRGGGAKAANPTRRLSQPGAPPRAASHSLGKRQPDESPVPPAHL